MDESSPHIIKIALGYNHDNNEFQIYPKIARLVELDNG